MKFPAVKFIVTGLVFFTIFSACKPEFSAKPRAYYRIALPAKEYIPLEGNYPYRFDIPKYARIEPYSGTQANADTTRYWMNIGFPQFRSRIHITYKQVLNNLPNLIDDAHTFAFKHSIKADAINQHEYSNPDNHVFGILFDIKGNTASSLQFYLTDSTRHFLRGALYFDNEPNKDSIAPVNDFLRQDIERLIETLTWNFKP